MNVSVLTIVFRRQIWKNRQFPVIYKSNNNSYHDGASAFFSMFFQEKTRTLMPLRKKSLMMINCFCWMPDQGIGSSLMSSWDHCQRSSPLQIPDMPRGWFEPAQNLSSGFLESSYTELITTTPWRRVTGWTIKSAKHVNRAPGNLPSCLFISFLTVLVTPSIITNWWLVLINGELIQPSLLMFLWF